LAEGSIAGAALDVTDPEPLPQGDPLYRSPRCLITCHSAARVDQGAATLRTHIRANILRFVAGEPLLGRVDPSKGY
jgi:phosphoglycerate dehydrogenase-like enzyme